MQKILSERRISYILFYIFLFSTLFTIDVSGQSYEEIMDPALKYLERGDYKKLEKKSKKIFKKIDGEYSKLPEYLLYKDFFWADFYMQTSQFSALENTLRKAEEKIEPLKTSKSEDFYLEQLSILCGYYNQISYPIKTEQHLEALRRSREKTKSHSYSKTDAMMDLALGEAWLQMGYFDKAKKAMEAVSAFVKAENEPLSFASNLLTARYYREIGLYTKADASLNTYLLEHKKYLKENPLLLFKARFLQSLIAQDEGSLEKAIDILNKAEDDLQNVKAGHQYKFMAEYQMSRLFYALGDENKCEKYLENFQKRVKKQDLKAQGNLIYALFLEAKYQQLREKKDKTADAYADLWSHAKKVLPSIHSLKAQILEERIEFQLEGERSIENAGKNYLLFMDQERVLLDIAAPKFQFFRICYADYLLRHTDDLEEARKIYAQNPHTYFVEKLDKKHKDYVKILNYTAHYFEENEEILKALDVYALGLGIFEENNKKEALEYAIHQLRYIDLGLKAGKIQGADDAIESALKVIEKNEGNNSLSYARALGTSARLYNYLGMYNQSEKRLRKSRKIFHKLDLENDKEALEAREELSQLYLKIGKYEETETLLQEVIKEEKQKYGKESRKLIKPYLTFIKLYITLGNYSEAEKCMGYAEEIIKNVFGQKSRPEASLSRLRAEWFMEVGNLEKAEEMIKKALLIDGELLGDQHFLMAQSLELYAKIMYRQDPSNIAEVEQILLEAMRIRKQQFGEQHPLYAESLLSLAYISVDKKDFETAKKQLKEADKIYRKKLSGNENAPSAEIASLLGKIAFLQKNYPEAQEFFLESEKMYTEIFSETHPKTLNAKSFRGKVLYLSGKKNAAAEILVFTTQSYLDFMKNFFPHLSEAEKDSYLKIIQSDFEFFLTLATDLAESKPELMENAYNHALATKAILLNSSQKVRKNVLKNGTPEQQDTFLKWTQAKEQIGIVYSGGSAVEQNDETLSELLKEVERLEKELSLSFDGFKDEADANVNFSSLCKELENNEAAIEVLRFRKFDGAFSDSIYYLLLVAHEGAKNTPEFVILKNGNHLENQGIKYYRNCMSFTINDFESYKSYWKPVDEILDKLKINTVFLSPDGVYNQISIPSLRMNEETFVIDKSQIVLLSSCRDLYVKRIREKALTGKEKRKIRQQERSLVLFGNPKFYAHTQPSSSKVAALPGTQSEIEFIASLYKSQSGWNVQMYQGVEADENTLKNMDQPTVLHIASHGFFKPALETSSDLSLASYFSTYQSPLLRSGIMASGAGDLLDEYPDNYNAEDGILTAYEVMNLSLDQTELVVLSACETGLGEIQIGEGVIGLQRAFLVAGVDMIIMSLFKVSDEITQELMSGFYSYWLQTKDKRKAFALAQKDIRQKYPKPIYWGAFNMMGVD